MKLPLHSRQIGKNVGVVKLQIVKNQGARPVMHKLRTFIEKSAVVLVGLDNKKRRCPEPGGLIKILRYAAD